METGATRVRYLRRRTRRRCGQRAGAVRADRRASAPRRPLTRRRQTTTSAPNGSSLTALRDVECVQYDKHVQQARNDDEGVAVLVGSGYDVPRPELQCLGDEVWNPDTDVGERGERHERLGWLKG